MPPSINIHFGLFLWPVKTGCINDVKNMKQFLVNYWNFREVPSAANGFVECVGQGCALSYNCILLQQVDMVMLTDDSSESKFQPTRANIIAAMRWLVRDAQPNDRLIFFFFSSSVREYTNLDIHDSLVCDTY